MTKAADAIGLAALRAPQSRERPEPKKTKKPKRRRMRLNLGRFAFTAVVLYLVGTGITGEIQLLRVQSQEAQAARQLQAINARNGKLAGEVKYYRSPAGERAAIRDVLHFVPKGETAIQFTKP